MRRSFLVVGFLVVFSLFSFRSSEYWGFFGHRLINRTAVYTLPLEFYGFYKTHIEYIEYHSIDPDRRRYAVNAEEARHYIDLDYWEQYELLKGRSISEIIFEQAEIIVDDIRGLRTVEIEYFDSITSFLENAIYVNYQDQWTEILSDGKLKSDVENESRKVMEVSIIDKLSEHGISPYHLTYCYYRLEQAFADQNVEAILKYSSEIGHYISDAHVSLHTTENYDGQLTGQNGIHEFWESRIPESFAFQEYDLFVDKARYIEDIGDYVWDVVLDTHELVDKRLSIEKELTQSWPEDQQYCYDKRGASVMRLQCDPYAKVYQDKMEDMVETQMRKSITALGSIWYTAWENEGRHLSWVRLSKP